jgi:hypothetical protein
MVYNNELFINKANEVHLYKYDYSTLEYTKLCDKVNIICSKHGKFTQRAQSHLSGSGCKKCYLESRNPTFDDFLKAANEKHNNKYLYKNYKSMKSKVTIICPNHGNFNQMAYKHLMGQTCPLCSQESRRLNILDFIERSKYIHKDKYDYSKVEYVNHSTKVTIICPTHADFKQTPNNHMTHNKGCPKCSVNISKKEIEWLDHIDHGSIIRQYTIKIGDKIYKVDGYDPKTKTIYEFYGDFWHGNINIYSSKDINTVIKKSFGDLYKKTIERERHLKSLGYNFISIWESEYKKRKRK